MLAQLGLGHRDVAVGVHQVEQLPEQRRQAIGQPVDRAEVQHAEPPVVQQAEIPRMRVGVQQPGPRRAGEQQPDKQHAGPVPLLLVPSEMILASGVPSIHSLTRTWSVASTVGGTKMSGSPANASANAS